MKRWGWVLLGCLLPAFAASGEELGRLFFTPAERADLERQRRLGKPPEKTVANGTKALIPAKPGDSAIVRVGGYVQRGDGRATIWVNGQPVQEKTTTKEVEVVELRGDSNQVRLRISGIGQVISLKAGQSYDPGSGKILNSLRNLPMDKDLLPSKVISTEISGRKVQ